MSALQSGTPLTSPAGCPFSHAVRETPEGAELVLHIPGARCAGCLNKIEQAVGALPGVSRARLNLSSGHLRIVWCGKLQAERIADTVLALGYDVRPAQQLPENDVTGKAERALLIDMGLAGFAAANIMLLSVSIWAGHGEMGAATRQILHALSGAIALPTVLYAGRSFFRSAWSVLRRGHANMDVPISLALLLAFGVSVWDTATGGRDAYFDACVMLLFFLLVGRFLDARLRRRATSAAQDLAALTNRVVTRLGPDGAAESIDAARIQPGDRLLITSGERVPVDFEILDGQGLIDESLATGESLPRTVMPGLRLKAGSVNLSTALRVKAIATASDSLIGDLGRLLETGEQRRARYRQIADKAVSLYIPFVHTTAALAIAAWLLLGAGVTTALQIGVTTLIITCPCALALAAPVAQVTAAGRLFRQGVYLKSGDALERLAEINHIVFDKTGTLTFGAPTLTAILRGNTRITAPFGAATDYLQDAAELARSSRHPLSRALVDAAGPGPVIEGTLEVPGRGLEAEKDGQTWRLGSADWLGLGNSDFPSGPTLWFQRGGAPPVGFSFRDTPRPEAHAAIAELARHDYGMEILSGDRPAAVAKTAEELGLENWQAGVDPSNKVAQLEALREGGRCVLMVGDGLNDAGALALAHAALTPGGAMDISQSASDGVFSGGLDALPFVLKLAKRSVAVMHQNFGLAAAYNAVAVPIAVTGHVTPLIAAIAMSASSLIVTLNALRLNA